MNPKEVYTSAARYAAEEEKIFHGAFLFACHSSELPPGACLSVDASWGSAVLMRSQSGEIKAFANTCRHMGMRLAAGKSCPAGGKLHCAYHGWTYDLNGQLTHVPKQEVFSGLNPGAIQLTPLPLLKLGDFYFVSLDPDAGAPPGWEMLKTAFEPVAHRNFRLIHAAGFDIACNWKAVMEQGMESYHALTAHADTLANAMDFNGIQTKTMGEQVYCTYPLRAGAAARLLGVLPSTDTIFHRVTIFPFSMFSAPVPGRHLSVTAAFPVSPERTSVLFRFYVTGAGFSPRLRLGSWLACLRSRQILLEDLRLLEARQQGLRAAQANLIGFGGLEKGARIFHGAINTRLAPLEEKP